jgi:hypothetical protein
MASIFASKNLTYQAGDDRLIGIKKLLRKCREYVMNILQQQKWKPCTVVSSTCTLNSIVLFKKS